MRKTENNEIRLKGKNVLAITFAVSRNEDILFLVEIEKVAPPWDNPRDTVNVFKKKGATFYESKHQRRNQGRIRGHAKNVSLDMNMVRNGVVAHPSL